MIETVGDWMIQFEQEQRIKHRIACPEQGYPCTEARYISVEEWEKATNKNWYDYISEIA
jgi:hypothetical protein